MSLIDIEKYLEKRAKELGVGLDQVVFNYQIRFSYGRPR